MQKSGLKSFIRLDVPSGILELKTTRSIVLIQNHHTFIPGYKDFSGKNHRVLLSSMERAHLRRGFGGPAQHFTTFPDGSVWTGRSLDIDPCGIYGANGGAICLEHLGNFDEGKDRMTKEQASVIVDLNASLCARFNLEPNINSVVYHHWFDLRTGERKGGQGSVKTCPGTAFFGGNSEEVSAKNFIPKIKDAMGVFSSAVSFQGTIKLTSGSVRVPKGDTLNIREGPGIKYRAIGKLEQDSKVEILEVKNGWYRISSSQGWVRGKYVKIEDN